MTYLIIAALLIAAIASVFSKSKKAQTSLKPEVNLINKNRQEVTLDDSEEYNLTYSEKLNKTKDLYPFAKWRENFFEFEMEQYTEENCNEAKAIFDNLISALISLGENGSRNEKEKRFEIAINSLNKLNDKNEGIIETGEREDLCELIDQITIATGLNPQDYADGEGIADLWREW